jgi:hypothetical protein
VDRREVIYRMKRSLLFGIPVSDLLLTALICPANLRSLRNGSVAGAADLSPASQASVLQRNDAAGKWPGCSPSLCCSSAAPTGRLIAATHTQRCCLAASDS